MMTITFHKTDGTPDADVKKVPKVGILIPDFSTPQKQSPSPLAAQSFPVIQSFSKKAEENLSAT